MSDNPVQEQSAAAAGAAAYDATHIKVLGGIEAVRTRPGMYIGDTTARGLHHLVYEVLDNAVDEHMAGYARHIQVKLQADGSASVVDDGRGIPVDLHRETGRPALEIVMTMLHAGGKFDRKTYRVSGGLHGVGVSVVNALSEWLEVEVYRDGNVYRQRYERGKPTTDVERLGKANRVGTKVTFKPDATIFPDTVLSYDVVAKRLRELAFLNKGLTISMHDDRSERADTFVYEGGLRDFVGHLNQNKTPLHADIVTLVREDGANRVEVALQYNDGYNETVFCFANNINTHEGGTHLSGFRSALTRTMNAVARKLDLLKSEKPPSGDDYHEGLTAIVDVKLPEPQFEGQTKTKLGNHEIQGIVEAAVNEGLGGYLEEHPQTATLIITKALLAAHAREAARKAREIARKSVLGSGALPGKLADCSSRKIDETEIFIVEGDSAGGSAKQARSREFQAVLPLKGKILNVEKARADKMLTHEEIRVLITALGTGIGTDDFDLKRLRYGKVIMMCDADVDGSHIRTLLLTFFFRHMVALIENGRIYAAQPPLYRVRRKKKEEYVHSEKEMTRTLVALALDGAALEAGEGGRRIDGEALRSLASLLETLDDQAVLTQRQGVSFGAFLRARDPETGKLPYCRARHNGTEKFFHSDVDLNAYIREQEESSGEPFTYGADDVTDAPEGRVLTVVEFPLAPRVQETLQQLERLGFAADEYLGTGKGAGALRLLGDGETVPLKGLRELLKGLRTVGQKGLDVQRYKGLGEMNPDQLWETTMNPATRTLVRINIEDAVRADRIFTILMGEQVEPRREFIERHALEVKNLDI